MVNLLGRTEPNQPFPPLDPEQRERFESRLTVLAAKACSSSFLRQLDRGLDVLEESLEELESEPSLATALDLLDRIDRARIEVSAGSADRDEGLARSSKSPVGGELICYLPGRSLSSGQAGVASRGFFDVLDRPPIGFWVEAIARPLNSSHERFEIAVIAWIPAQAVERATAGRRACVSGSLMKLGEASDALLRQLSPILSGS